MRIHDRRADAMTVTWKDSASLFESQNLERSVEDGPFQVIAELAGSSNGWSTFVDTGLDSDKLHRYRVRVQNEYGSNVTVPNDMAVGYTRTVQDLPVWRIQVYLRVADVADGGTADSVQVRLQSPLLTTHQTATVRGSTTPLG